MFPPFAFCTISRCDSPSNSHTGSLFSMLTETSPDDGVGSSLSAHATSILDAEYDVRMIDKMRYGLRPIGLPPNSENPNAEKIGNRSLYRSNAGSSFTQTPMAP